MGDKRKWQRWFGRDERTRINNDILRTAMFSRMDTVDDALVQWERGAGDIYLMSYMIGLMISF